MKRKALISFIVFNVLVILALTGMFILSEAYPLRPGAPFYKLQHVAEQWRIRLSAGQAGRAAFALDLAERRLADLAQAGDQRRVNAAAVAFDRALDEAARQVEASPQPERAALNDGLMALLGRAEMVLAGLEPAGDNAVLATLQRQVLTMQQSNAPEEVVTFVVEPVELLEAEPIPFLGQDIDHTVWPLTGGHDGLECEDCHEEGVYAGTPSDCEDCHEIPDSELYADHFEGECLECHLVDTWDPSEFDHAGIIDCQSCHEDESPEEHYVRSNDNWWLLSILSNLQVVPTQGSLLDQRHYDRCADCHISTVDWQEIRFDHFGFTDCQSCHPLEGDLADHYEGQCSLCHTIDNWEPFAFKHASIDECRSCHVKDSPSEHYLRADNSFWYVSWVSEQAGRRPSSAYAIQQTPATCANCHPNTEDWDDVAFDHTGFDDCETCHLLEGDLEDHYAGQCSNCHIVDTWEEVDFDHTGYTDCQDCHTLEQDHYPDQCSLCHTVDDWLSIEFTHEGFAPCSSCHGWQAPDEHFDGPCSLCHTTNEWTEIIYKHSRSDDCKSCHILEFVHYRGQCSLCHNTSTWTEGNYRHIGNEDCRSCHSGPSDHYRGQCSLCHKTSTWLGGIQPHSGLISCASCHALPAGHYAGVCTICHTTSSWQEIDFDHANYTDCRTCHEMPEQHYPAQCSACHNTDNWSSYYVNHVALTSCSSCHTAPGSHWYGECSLCHDSETWYDIIYTHYVGSDCASCHLAPADHWYGQCSLCHNMTTWSEISMDHTLLTDCLSCHIPPDGHWPGQCSSCHGTSSWDDYTFNHDGYDNCKACHSQIRPASHDRGQCSKCHNTSSWSIPDTPTPTPEPTSTPTPEPEPTEEAEGAPTSEPTSTEEAEGTSGTDMIAP